VDGDLDARRDAPDDRALLFQAVIDCLPDAIFAKDLEGRYLVANRQAAFNMTGDADFSMIGLTDEQIVGAETAAWIVDNDAWVLRSGDAARLEETLDLPDGPHVFITSKAPYRDARGDTAGLVGAARDVPE